MLNLVSRAALLLIGSLLYASCAEGVSGVGLTGITDPSLAGTGGLGMTGGTGGLGLTGGLTGGVAVTGGLAVTGGPGGVAPIAGTGGPGGTEGGVAAGGGGAGLPPGARMPARLPAVSGACPEFMSGDVMVMPAGEAARKVYLWSAQGTGGPLVIYWHSTGAQPSEASVALSGVIEEIIGMGGVVAAPYPGTNEGMYPWVNTTPAALKVADAIVACAIMKKNINPARIHSIGYSAGGLMASSLATQRSSYMASIAAYSGGQTGTTRPTFEDPTNKISVLLFHGGAMDTAGGTNFPMAASSYATAIKANGGAAVICNHNLGRSMPPEGPMLAWRFFQDHPYGRTSPYAAMLPGGYPMGCMLQP